MSGVVCAIRGGPASQPTILEAISLAKESGHQLYFLYVVNLDFLERTASSRTHTILTEIRHMGEFILLTAQSQAESEGISAECVVRDGNVGEEIIRLCKEIKAEYVVLGSPQHEGEENVFTHERLEKFGQIIEEASGAVPVFVEG